MEGLEPDDPETLGPYRLMARLGAGGMGRVFLARSPNGSTVAVKMIRAELAADLQFRDRFRREVAAAQAVSGPWTAAVVGADPDAAVPWMATAYVLGRSLADAVADYGPLPPRSLQGLGAGLAEALCVVHAAGLAHRDLKPSNVLLAADGPRVIDFGIARAADGDRMTTTGAVVGSPGYMSPEQAYGQDAGPAGDVFCLASVMMYAATGRGPFDGSPAALLYQVVHAEPDLARLPPVLAQILRPCFAKSPDARPTPRQIAEAFAPGGAAAVLGDGWLPADLAGSIARHAATVLQMDTPSQATRLERPATGRHRRAGEGGMDPVTVQAARARRRVLLGSAAIAVAAAAGGGGAYAIATRSGKKPGTGSRVGGLTKSTSSARPSALPSGVAPEPLWRVAVNAPVPSSAPTVAGSLVLIKTDNMAQSPFAATMTALDLTTGKHLWAYPGILNEQAPPVVAGGFAVTLDSNNNLITLSVATGEATTTITPAGKAQFLDVLAATPTTAYILGIADNTTSSVDYVLWAVRLPTGKLRWRQADGNKRINSGTELIVADSMLICSDARHNVTVRSATTGAARWNVNIGRGSGVLDTQPYLAASPRLGIAITARAELSGRDLATGARKWLVPAIAADNAFSQPVMSADGTICYVVIDSNPGAVLAVEARTGYKKWDTSQYFTGQNRPALAAGLLFMSGQAGGQAGMYAFDGATGKNLWSFQDATATGGNEWMLAGVPSSGTVVALHDSALLALPAVG